MFNLTPATLISRLLVLVIAFTVHEFAHAAVADYFGDPTPRSEGRLTLNPLVHLDLFGSLMLLIAGFGWARPVRVNPYLLRRRSRWAELWVAFAGPLSNLLLALIAAIPFRLGLAHFFLFGGNIWFPTFSQFMTEFLFLNLVLMLFNLLPVAPLDGEKVLGELLPPQMAYRIEQIRPYGPAILLVLIFLLPYLGIDVLGLLIGWPASRMAFLLIG